MSPADMEIPIPMFRRVDEMDTAGNRRQIMRDQSNDIWMDHIRAKIRRYCVSRYGHNPLEVAAGESRPPLTEIDPPSFVEIPDLVPNQSGRLSGNRIRTLLKNIHQNVHPELKLNSLP